ncbi:MAG: tRNA uridine-5-carboxymethylaminomethyl(34) synthesis GTPase MnmE [Candidatus Aquicultor secundus]|uniref:tRNA modification GTPase MnmE n=2 Tax=Candidatus Aquicultor secundus TaxID=1973895 RepID=A0A2M7T8H7_9ACTN|nr:MAG: tRNA uridine-5-carboxymethylaminomethyl(34) synthesis GTPase MnmE [Candidatus Aquicultor secundus]PIW22208.1 MAG: tRNA uridine-5-carboxymethylaminomethyl(34) synthesis GTPase MnmE [Candidatus Aquicultor secundus]PIX51663.1 MAG: tRNA uridine-5-carboxymethylaminomethyl(34) synthesis GTPase MnmE [Candidatus Aquicultor secundus]PIY37546.1 MAG: tRNA uridine-5-carboxymethylaminomethyl(34) synthesis GTPase MnmE [Candidatus Aquicultor secundus]PIZ39758.1 MAG: tRNA uridine-5-carboxymethylaminome
MRIMLLYIECFNINDVVKMMFYGNDTIAAISTAVGEGGIGIIRISGDAAISVAEKVVKKRKGAGLGALQSHSMFLASVVDPVDGSQIDEALVSIMRAPYTYTREDVVEINCHGGVMALRKTLGAVLSAGARAAEAGEFTKRAFLNGRIDLTQAEAVIDTIRSKTDAALKAAVSQLEGGLSEKIRGVAEKVADVLTQVEAAVDFSDEDIETLPATVLFDLLNETNHAIEQLLTTAIRGRMIKEGVRTAIIGKPNVGKSSLLNALLRKERAIVTPIPGTTRDVIEETITIKGIPLVLQDTAGIREASDEVEKIGVRFAQEAIRSAEIVLFVVDGSRQITAEDTRLLHEVDGELLILVVNKSDLPPAWSAQELALPDRFKARVELSALSGDGIEVLEETVERMLLAGSLDAAGSAIVTNARHEQLLKHAQAGVNEAMELIKTGRPEEIIATVLRDALDNLGEITGETVGDDVLGRIFSQFCIGK